MTEENKVDAGSETSGEPVVDTTATPAQADAVETTPTDTPAAEPAPAEPVADAGGDAVEDKGNQATA